MKRWMTSLFSMCLVFSLAGCGGNSSKGSTAAPPEKSGAESKETEAGNKTETKADDKTGAEKGAETGTEGAKSAASGEKYELFWSSTSTSSGFYAFNVAVADIINKYVDNVTVTVLESGGTADNLNNIENGQASFGQCSEPDLFVAQNGIGLYEGKPYEKARLLFLACPLAYYFVTSEDSGAKTIADLDGKVYSPGLAGSSTELLSYDLIETVLGHHPDWYPASTGEAVNAMKDRRIIGFTKSGAVNSFDSTIQDVSTSVDINILSFTPEEEAKILEKYPYYGFTTVDGSIFNQEEDIRSVALFFGPMVSSDLPEDVVYEIVKAIFEHQDYIEEAYAGIKGIDMLKLTAESSASYMHPGLIKYLKEQGYDIKESQIPPEMKN